MAMVVIGYIDDRGLCGENPGSKIRETRNTGGQGGATAR